MLPMLTKLITSQFIKDKNSSFHICCSTWNKGVKKTVNFIENSDARFLKPNF